jgi:hypothetical protein
MKKVKNNNYVEGYFIEKYDSGIIQLCINTKERWLHYGSTANNNFYVGDNDDDGWDLEIDKEELNIGSYYLMTNMQDKNQIYFYWIPFELITSGSDFGYWYLTAAMALLTGGMAWLSRDRYVMIWNTENVAIFSGF